MIGDDTNPVTVDVVVTVALLDSEGATICHLSMNADTINATLFDPQRTLASQVLPIVGDLGERAANALNGLAMEAAHGR